MNDTPVLFSRGKSSNFVDLDKDPNTIYFVEDKREIYLGNSRFAIGKDINVIETGEGVIISDIVWHQKTRTLEIIKGDDSALKEYVEAIVDSILDGFRVVDNDPLLSQDSKGISSSISLTLESEDERTYIKLLGKDGKIISSIDTSQFRISGNLKSASLSVKEVSGETKRILTMEFNTPNQDIVNLDVDALIRFGSYQFVEAITDESTHRQIPTAKAVDNRIKDNICDWETV